MQLKRYQQEALHALKAFLEKTRESNDAAASFSQVTKGLSLGRYGGKYRPLKDLPDTPYACIRIPTGGGKTILGAYTVKLAGSSFLERDNPVALWLVPSNTIRKQTVESLKNPHHAYRQVLDDAFDGRVRIFDIADFTRIRPTDMLESACIIVGTIQTLRVEKTEGRKVYDHHEALEPHFARISRFPAELERDEAGKPKFSFANLLHLHHPLMIVDEAHNAVTNLSREVQARINPACIIEFTATPKPRSNVLFSVSATALKDEEMITLPIVLTAHKSWQAAVNGSLAERTRLLNTAKTETDYIRPIVLFQAQNKDREVPAEALKRHLIDNERIPVERIAVVTGDQRELDGIDLFDPECPIEYVITVKALKEGWDCSFAYVFCSVANIRSSTDVEQLLGRVLRMPYARRRRQKELNSAYAHVCEPNFIEAAVHLKDRLVDMGFEAEEAEDNIEVLGLSLDGEGDDTSAVPEPVSLVLETEPVLADLPELVRERVRVEETSEGGAVLIVEAPVDEAEQEAILALVPEENWDEARKQLEFQRHRAERLESPAAKREAFAVPRLCLTVQGDLELAEPELFLDLSGWNLLDYTARLSPDEFKIVEGYQSFALDVDDKEKVTYERISDEIRRPELAELHAEWDEKVLARWLDRQCRAADIPQSQLLEFVRRIVSDQLESKKVDLAALVRAKYRLVKAITAKIGEYRKQAQDKGYQACLFQSDAPVETCFDFTFNFSPDTYPANSYYRGSYRFQKHYYGAHRVGDLKNTGEEFECARALDMQPAVKYWVRNLDSRPDTSFRLPRAHRWFYPDFVALLEDGRILVVEYKGEQLIDKRSEKEKANVGALWEAKSQHKGLFLMVEKEKNGLGMFEQINSKIS